MIQTLIITVIAMYIIGVVAVLGLLHTINEQYKLTPIDWVVMSLTSWWGIGSVLGDLINSNWKH